MKDRKARKVVAKRKALLKTYARKTGRPVHFVDGVLVYANGKPEPIRSAGGALISVPKKA